MNKPKHISARLTWHADGWNGKICEGPEANTYCTGQFSYPGEMYEKKHLQKLEAEKQIEMTNSLVRRKMSTMDGFKKLNQIVVDFEALKVYESELKGSVFICTLGTTIKKAKTFCLSKTGRSIISA